MTDLNGKVALVTGGGTGIGKAIASKFAGLGAAVVIAGRRQDVIFATAAELGGSVSAVVMDLVARGATRSLVDETIARHGQLDVLVNNAGDGTAGPLVEATDDDIAGTFALNIEAPLRLARDALPHLIETKGSIVNISSVMAHGAEPRSVVYSASKAALEHATRVLAAEVGPTGVRVNAVAPGLTETDMTASMRADKDILAYLLDATPMGRVGKPYDIANVVAFLASEEAGWVTGQVVQASGGMML